MPWGGMRKERKNTGCNASHTKETNPRPMPWGGMLKKKLTLDPCLGAAYTQKKNAQGAMPTEKRLTLDPCLEAA
jgi:hypothetical protein